MLILVEGGNFKFAPELDSVGSGMVDTKEFSPINASEAFRRYYAQQRDPQASVATSPLHVAVLNGDGSRVKKLLTDMKLNASTQDQNGSTPLHHAALQGRLDIARMLLHHGAEIMAFAKDGNTPLHKAAQGGSIQLVMMLVHAGADLATRNKDRFMPIDLSARRKHTEVTVFLSKLAKQAEI